MKTSCYLLILLHFLYFADCDDTWNVSKWNKLSNSNLRQLSKIAKVTHNTAGLSAHGEVIPGRLARSFGRPNSRQSRIEEAVEETAITKSEVTNNTISDEVQAEDRSTQPSLMEKELTGYEIQPGRRESAGKRKQPPKLTTPPKTGISEGTPKPTKYHYYPHNQHIYLLPECAIQQVCNAVYVRLNYTQPLCACPSRKEPCSASLNADDMHTTELVTASTGKVLTLVKTCEPIAEMRICRAPRDWSLLALQNVRTGKSHYLVICRCPHKGRLEGPMSHDQPAYASVPGIRVYGMMCVRDSYRISRPFRYRRSTGPKPQFPWDKVKELQSTVQW